jgi:hypothetical protein
MKAKYISMLAIAALTFTACNDDDEDEDNNPGTELTIPSEYLAPNYDTNVATESMVLDELSALTEAANEAESDAVAGTMVDEIDYPATLSSVTLPSYRSLIEEWKTELVAAANSPTDFQIPAIGEMPDPSEEGGILGSRLLDEHGLELEQMIEKGSFGAALYNHALTLKNKENITAADIDRLVEIFGASPAFSPEMVTASANYAKRRSDQTTQSGFLYEMRDNAITAKAAIEGGSEFNATRDEALNSFLLNWEKSNFATVIYYCNAAKTGIQEATQIQDETERRAALGSAMHAYAEGVGFTHGFRNLDEKLISDAEIETILNLMLAPVNEDPESYRFINEGLLLSNFDQIIEDIQIIYGFTDEEVEGFYVNN